MNGKENRNSFITEPQKLFENYQGLLYTIAYSVLLDHEDSLDVVQETFVKGCGQENFFQAGFQQKTWLVQVVRNLAINHRKRLINHFKWLRKWTNWVGNNPQEDLLERLERNENLKRLRMVMQRLDKAEREILSLRYGAEMSYREIAETLQIKEGTVM
ncbi:RNA polymerase sigma factor, partial [Candidatus Riflebacteria bacterium]